MSGRKSLRSWLWAGLLAPLPLIGTGDVAHQAVREGNQLYQAGQYGAALERYQAAAEALPDAPEIAFNRADALVKSGQPDRALDAYLGALSTEDARLASRAKYNIGVVKYQQALDSGERFEEALALAQAAIGYFRESLELDRDLADARYNLELVYRFRRHVELELLHAQRNAEVPPAERTSLRRGQAFADKVRNEGSGQRKAAPDMPRETHGQRASGAPENFSNTEEKSEPPSGARLPMAMSPDAARKMMEELRNRLQAAETWRLQQRRALLQQIDEETPW
jgi:tetratricopeptide (TPR) repeat protein